MSKTNIKFMSSNLLYRAPKRSGALSKKEKPKEEILLVKLGETTRQRINDLDFPSSAGRLQEGMEDFFVDHERFIENNFEGLEREGRLQDLEERAPQLIDESTRFSALARGLSTPAIVFSSDEYDKLAEIREGIDPNFLEDLLSFYKKLEELIQEVVENIQIFGMDYFMNGPDDYSAQMAEALKEVFAHMKSTEGLIDQLMNQLEKASVLKRAIIKRLMEKEIESYTPEAIGSAQGLIEETNYCTMEEKAIVDLVHGLGADSDEDREKVLDLIQMNLSHMSGALAAQYLPVLSDHETVDGKSVLEVEADTTPEQMEFLFSMINKCVRLLSNVYYIRDNLLVEQQPVIEQEVLSTA